MFLKNFCKLISVIVLLICFHHTQAQDNTKGPGENDKDAPGGSEEIHQEKHDIKARERQIKATRVYSDMDKIRIEKKKIRLYKRTQSREDYVRAKESLKHYKQHLRADRRRNRSMDVFD